MIERTKRVPTPRADQPSRVGGDAPGDPSVGELINARYLVVSHVAAGPTGALYRARDVGAGAEVTLKLLPGRPGLDDTLVRRLRDELSVTRALARVQPNVAVVHDFDRTADGRAFVVMESLKGRSLLELIRQDEPVPVERALRLAVQIAEGLEAAHSVQLVHGALDAEHVWVVSEETVKLTGFEVARLRAAAFRSRSPDPAAPTGVAGSPRPERAEALTEAGDIQAVGFVLLEMLARGVRPRSQGSGVHPERKRGREIPAAVKEIVMQTLVSSPEPQPRDRGGLAKALSVELNRVTQLPASRARRRARPLWPPVRWRVVVIGVLVAPIIALGAWVARSHMTALTPVTPVIQAIPARESALAPAPVVPEPVVPGRSTDVAVEPPPAPPTLSPPVVRVAPLVPERPVVQLTPPATGDDAQPKPRATPHPPKPPAVKTTPPPTSDSAQAGSRVPVTPAPERGPPRQEPDAPDPSAIIDWLLNESPLQRR